MGVVERIIVGQRHVDILIEYLELKGANGVTTHGESEPRSKEEENNEELELSEATMHRSIVARANHLEADRPDLMYASKECSRKMANPQKGDWEAIKRTGWYHLSRMRVVHMFRWQEQPDCITAFSDSNWAGCLRTRKSTSGACFMHGSHLLKAYSKTQSNVALSSGEAEF